MRKYRLSTALLFAAGPVFLALAVAYMLTEAPWWDEGFLAGPPSNLASNGIFGAHVLTNIFPGAERYMYWNMPLYFVILTGWFKAFSPGILAMRCLSLVCGLAALAAWYVVMIRLLNDKLAAALVVFLLGTDYVFVLRSVTGRMDMMTAAFGVSGLAAYLSYRGTGFNRAILLAACGAAGAFFCHPLGMIYAGIVCFSVLYFDWRRIRPRHVLFAALPFAICAGLWAIYILQAPGVFSAQMNIYSHRFQAVWNPIVIVRREIEGRYLTFYYSMSSARLDRPLVARLKVLGLIPYLLGFLLALSSRSLRSTAEGRLIILMTPLAALLLAFGDVTQSPQYFLHVFSFALAALAAGWSVYWRQGKNRFFLSGLLIMAAGIGIGGLAGKIYLNEYRKIYDPVVAAILPHLTGSSLVDGPCELIFPVGDSRLIDGMSRESYEAHKPDFIVIGRVFGNARVYEPERYRLTYRNVEYSVYRAK